MIRSAVDDGKLRGEKFLVNGVPHCRVWSVDTPAAAVTLPAEALRELMGLAAVLLAAPADSDDASPEPVPLPTTRTRLRWATMV
jgi:hypothetical protein